MDVVFGDTSSAEDTERIKRINREVGLDEISEPVSGNEKLEA